jgi:hypothetical protein
MNNTETAIITQEAELVLTELTDANTSEEDVNEVIRVVEKSNPYTYEHDLKHTISFTPHSIK